MNLPQMDPGDMPKKLLVFGLKISEIFKKEHETVVQGADAGKVVSQTGLMPYQLCLTPLQPNQRCQTLRTQIKDSESMSNYLGLLSL
jgi:hypothetical protein